MRLSVEQDQAHGNSVRTHNNGSVWRCFFFYVPGRWGWLRVHVLKQFAYKLSILIENVDEGIAGTVRAVNGNVLPSAIISSLSLFSSGYCVCWVLVELVVDVDG